MTKKQLHNITDFVLDLIFPKYCVGCAQEGFWICPDCKEKIVLIKQSTCPNCHRLTRNGKFCSRCRKKSYLTAVLVAAYYQEGPLKEAIHTFKYEGVFDLAKDLGKLLRDRLNLIPLRRWNKVGVVVVPVPLHHQKQAMRGYNQAELLARVVCDHYPYQLAKNILVRSKKTKHSQVELSGKARRANVKGIFTYIGKKNQLEGKTVLLVDDIYTTGATLNECARVLRQDAKVKRIWALVLAKA